MAEEFQESEVNFSGYYNNDNGNDDDDSYLSYQEMVLSNNSSGRVARGGGKKKKTVNKKNKSVPVNINIPADNTFQYVDRDYEFEEEYDDDDGEIVPPHVIVGRRITGKMAFSVCTGNGRTLKGRDLSQVRNSILRMTGFLET